MSARAAPPGRSASARELRRMISVVAGGSSPATVTGASRLAMAASLAACTPTDDATNAAMNDQVHHYLCDCAAAPAAGIGDVVIKLAHVVRHLVATSGEMMEYEQEMLTLASAAMADLVLLAAPAAGAAVGRPGEAGL